MKGGEMRFLAKCCILSITAVGVSTSLILQFYYKPCFLFTKGFLPIEALPGHHSSLYFRECFIVKKTHQGNTM